MGVNLILRADTPPSPPKTTGPPAAAPTNYINTVTRIYDSLPGWFELEMEMSGAEAG